MEYNVLESFDYYPADPTAPGYGIRSTWIPVGGGVSLIAGRFAGQAMDVSLSTGSGNPSQAILPIQDSADNALGFAFKTPIIGNFGAGFSFYSLQDINGTILIDLHLNAIGNIFVYVGATLVGTCTDRFMLNASWHYIELEWERADVDGRIRLILDGDEQFEFTGDTNASAFALGQMQVRAATFVGISWICDDLYMLKDSAVCLGESRIQARELTSDFDVDWARLSGASNYLMVNTSDGDTTYNSSNTPGDLDLFEFDDVTVNPSVIHSVSLCIASRKEDSATRTIKGTISSAGDVAHGPDYNQIIDYTWTRPIFTLDPDGMIPWVKAKVNATKVGYTLVL